MAKSKEKQTKKYYPKSFIFEKKKTKIVERRAKQFPITEHTIHTAKGAVTFVKDEVFTDLQKLTDYQIGYYFDAK